MKRAGFLLCLLPTLGGVVGALIDERRHLGFTNWRAACRAAGPSLQSFIVFTRELLPSAIVAMLAGAFLVVLIGIVARRADGAARTCFAAHLGCFLSLPLMLATCMIAPAPAVMLFADVAFAALAAILVLRVISRRQRAPAMHP
jgi:hypothetical protein